MRTADTDSSTLAAPAAWLSHAIAVLAIVVPALALFYYKWGSADRTLTSVHHTGQWSSSITGLIAAPSTLGGSSYYFGKIVIALAIAVFLAAGVEAFAVPILVKKLGESGATMSGQLLAAASGMPLMLCSCCITPVFGAAKRGGATLRNSLTLMLASPTMNPAALLLTFLLFPTRLVLARIAGAAVIVFLLPRVAEKSEVGRARVAVAVDPSEIPAPMEGGFTRRYAMALWNVVAQTPVLIPGILLSALLLSRHGDLGAIRSSDALALAALAVTLIALPTYFEIPLALLALHAGGSGLAAVVLIAGPAINLPSLFSIWREVNARAALVIGFGVCFSATLIAFAVRA